MKNLSAISKKGIIVISAVVMIMAGALVVLLPSISRAHMSSGLGEGTAYVHVPMLNNTGETLIICRMYINVPDIDDEVCKQWKTSDDICCNQYQCKKSENSIAVKTIDFGDKNGENYENYYTNTSGSPYCHRNVWGDIADKIINHTDYTFSDSKVVCRIALDICPDDLPIGSGTSKEYTIRYYFTIDGGPEKSNTLTFNLP